MTLFAIVNYFFLGVLNFDLVPAIDDNGKETPKKLRNRTVQGFDADEALINLHGLLLDCMIKYWLPRHLIHVRKTTKQVNVIMFCLTSSYLFIDRIQGFLLQVFFHHPDKRNWYNYIVYTWWHTIQTTLLIIQN